MYDPDTTMEDHEKVMRNLLKKLHNAGGHCTDSQFRLIIIASLPKEWKPDVCNVPGTTSEAAFTYLHGLYLEKREEREEEERDMKRVKALLVKYGPAPVQANTTQGNSRSE